MSTKRFKRYCYVFGCMNKRRLGDNLYSFFRVPSDTERRNTWLRAIDRAELIHENKGIFVCSAHFKKSALVSPTSNRLKKDAVPTELLPSKFQGTSTQPPPNASEKHRNIDKSVQVKLKKSNVSSEPTASTSFSKSPTEVETEESHAIATISNEFPRKRKLTKEEIIVENKRRRLEQNNVEIKIELEENNESLPSNSEDEVTQKFGELVELHKQIKNKFKGNPDKQYKVFALNLHYAHPHSYRCLQTILKLPKKSTLSRIKLKIPPKLDDRVLNSLSLKMESLPENAKYCTVCVDEMALKHNLYYDIKTDEVIGFRNVNGVISPEVASNAYIIMLQGIYCDWDQPIAYALLGSTNDYDELDSWMNEVILKLFGVGLEVKAIVTKQGSNFDVFAKLVKSVTVEKPYFFVEEHKIFYIFDVPHLLNCVRDHLISNDLHYKTDKITWDHLKTLYEHQKDKNLILIPKITRAHIEPNDSQRMNVKYAAQIFSYKVSAALETYIDFGVIADEARGTVKFIKTMNDLFDVLNSSNIKSAFRMSANQKQILQMAQEMFSTIKTTTRDNNQNQIKAFHNFQITIQSVHQLFNDLGPQGFRLLFTRRLNQDNLEKKIGFIRQQASSSEPTPIQFTRAFSKLFHVSMLNTNQSNYEPDLYEALLKAEDIMNKESLYPSEDAKPSLVALDGDTDYRMDLPEETALTYIAGFLLYKCAEKHPSCDEMLTMHTLLSSDQTSTQYNAFNKSKPFYGNLMMPSQEMYEYVQKLDQVFTQNFEQYVHGNPGSAIYKLVQRVKVPSLPCSCFPIDYLLKLFVRLRIYSTLKFNSQNFKLGKNTFDQYLMVNQL